MIMIRRILSVAAAITLLAVNAQAQTETEKNRPAHIGLIYPLSTNGINAGECSNDISIHAIGGLSASENAFCISGVINVVKEEADGFIAAGVCNIIQDRANGAQLAGFMNYIKNDATGAQLAGFMNCTGNASGGQIAGFANMATGDVTGTQVAGFMNVARDADIQVAGFINTANDVTATQVAGFINKSGNVNSQIAGFINVAKEVKGVQLAGFINIAEKSKYPIGIINIIKEGEKSLGLTIDEDLTTLATFRSGGKVTYGILGLGFNLQDYEPLYALEVGLGAHIPTGIRNFRINAEVTATSLTEFIDQVTFRSGISLLPAVTLGKRIEIFAGPTIGYTNFDYAYGARNLSNYFWDTTYEGRYHATYIGGKAGIQFHL